MSNSEAPVPAPAAQTLPSLLHPLGASDDDDSVYGGSTAGSDTTSLKSLITRYREENGRTYHSYGSTEHWGPNDSDAQDQQDLTHHLWTLSLKGKLYLAPVKNPQRIFDLGTGTGIWVIEVADEHPEAVVEGIDLSPIQPTWIPPNARFEILDYNSDWVDGEKYDLIHARELLGTVPDWVEMYRNVYRYWNTSFVLKQLDSIADSHGGHGRSLKPGGWFDQAEPSPFPTSDHVKLEDDHAYPQWAKAMRAAGEKAGLSFDVGPYIKSRLEQVGFINVHEYRMPWTIGGWSKDKHQREVGQWYVCSDAISAFMNPTKNALITERLHIPPPIVPYKPTPSMSVLLVFVNWSQCR
jgi:SAM-dependent methyltransferase